MSSASHDLRHSKRTQVTTHRKISLPLQATPSKGRYQWLTRSGVKKVTERLLTMSDTQLRRPDSSRSQLSPRLELPLYASMTRMHSRDRMWSVDQALTIVKGQGLLAYNGSSPWRLKLNSLPQSVGVLKCYNMNPLST